MFVKYQIQRRLWVIFEFPGSGAMIDWATCENKLTYNIYVCEGCENMLAYCVPGNC